MDLESTKTLEQKFLVPEMRPETSATTSSPLPCDLGTFLSFSCRTRAEDFARTLQIKLKTLGSFDGVNSSTTSCALEESSWKSMSLDSYLSRQQNKKESTGQVNGSTNFIQFQKDVEEMTKSVTSIHHPSNSSVLLHPQNQNPNTSLDSDIYYDFDIASPGSPVENGSCYTVINPCDDLYCTDCLRNVEGTKDSIHHNPPGSSNGFSMDCGFESGCIFSSPASTSPDGNTGLPHTLNIQHSNSADDCTSDTSDCSIYYDVELIPSPIPSPKPVLEKLTLPKLEVEIPDIVKLSISEKSNDVIENGQKKLLLPPNFVHLNGEGSESDDDESSMSIPRITRSSSLKTGKTPPGTPGRKKIVRFADALGLDLAAVRTFLDEIPKVPKSAFRDLDYLLEPFKSPFFSPSVATFQKSSTQQLSKILVPTFHQPVSRPDFFDRIRDSKVLLENSYLSENFTIKGAVRVLNMDFHKSVYIRYTYDEWKTFTDFQATYVNGSCDGFSDRFEFTLYLRPDLIEIGSRLTLAVRFHCKGEQFWDNNGGSNYLFHCVPGTSPQAQQGVFQDIPVYPSMYSSSPEDPWINHMWL